MTKRHHLKLKTTGGEHLFQIDLKSRKAIYEQVVDNFKRLIVTGVLQKDEKVPSVRDMSKSLTVNPNTVQKAYRELESQGYIYTVLGQGSFIAEPPEESDSKEIAAIYGRIKGDVLELLFRKEPMERILEFVSSLRKEDN